jgi:hypothetical protein
MTEGEVMQLEPMWHVDVALSLVDDRTRADAIVEFAGRRFHGWGQAKRSPGDPSVPVVGEELAAARALSDLSHQLIVAAAQRIEDYEGRPVSLHG